MKTCNICGNSNFDTDTVCSRCKAPLHGDAPIYLASVSQNGDNIYQVNNTGRTVSGLTMATKIIMIICSFLYGIGLVVSLAFWVFALATELDAVLLLAFVYVVILLGKFILQLCMTLSYCAKVRSGARVSMAFKICSLLFLDVLTGVLMLCNSEN